MTAIQSHDLPRRRRLARRRIGAAPRERPAPGAKEVESVAQQNHSTTVAPLDPEGVE
jgi:hypothetical protein